MVSSYSLERVGSRKLRDPFGNPISPGTVGFPVIIERNEIPIITLESDSKVSINWDMVQNYALASTSPFDIVLQVFCKALWAVRKDKTEVQSLLGNEVKELDYDPQNSLRNEAGDK